MCHIMSHVTHVKETCVMSYMSLSHGKLCDAESFSVPRKSCVISWVMSHWSMSHESWVMSHLSISHVAQVYEFRLVTSHRSMSLDHASFYTCECVMSHFTLVDESWVMSHVTLVNESRRTCQYVLDHAAFSRVTESCVPSQMSMSHESWVMGHVTRVDESRRTGQ